MHAQMKNTHATLVTERLQLRRFTPEDRGLLTHLYRNARMMRDVGGVRTRKQRWAMLTGRILAYNQKASGVVR